MKARIAPLHGKYYGTTVEIFDGAVVVNEIKIWLVAYDRRGAEPSDRELEYQGITREEHERLYASDPDSTPVDITGGHYENRYSLRIAQIIVKALEKENLS